MSLAHVFGGLFSEEAEPMHSIYTEVKDAVIRHPQQIRILTPKNDEDPILFSITTWSARLAKFFAHLHNFQAKHPQHPSTKPIAHATADLLLGLIVPLHDLIDASNLVQLLITSIRTCLVPQASSALCNLARELSSCGNLLQHLISQKEGKAVVLDWLDSPAMSNLGPQTLASWTDQVANLLESCPKLHDAPDLLYQWRSLKMLLAQLKELARNRGKGGMVSVEVPSLANMMPLRKNDKKANIAQAQSHTQSSSQLEDYDHLLADLEKFHLPLPRSDRRLEANIAKLEGSRTLEILHDLIDTFPCGQCFKALSANMSRPQQIIDVEPTKATTTELGLNLDVFGKALGEWKIVLSVRALERLQCLERSVIAPVERKLSDLAFGTRHGKLVKADGKGRPIRIPLAKTKAGRAGADDRFILWQLDVGPSADNSITQQIIKIWDVGIDVELSNTIVRVAKLQQNYSEETVDRCHRESKKVDGKWLPIYFPQSDQTSPASFGKKAELDVRDVDQDTIDMANKFYALTHPVMKSIIDNDLSAEFPFDLSGQEKEVIAHFSTASLILGRSGTGKTTCLVFKLVGRYLARQAVVDEAPIHQVFVTRSGLLADKLRLYIRKLISTLGEKFENQNPSKEPSGSDGHRNFRDMNVRALGSEDFPLVCTYDELLVILENTMRAEDRHNFELGRAHQSLDDWNPISGKKIVDFQTFKLDYWRHFPKDLTRGLTEDLVYPEIMGVIKGSVSSRESLTPLSREDYIARNTRLTPHFASEADRQRVYDVFEAYKAALADHCQIDEVDRVVRILKTIRDDGSIQKLLASRFEEIYVDEVQDLRGLDIELPFNFIKDGRALHFAGDTAQTISQDSTFRFNDIKFLAGQHFGSLGEASGQRELAQPKMFTLTTNYRSHQGILNFASLVMDLLYKGFPKTVDKLKPEVGQLSGPQPVLFVGCSTEILLRSNTDLGKISQRSADFGAEQVILVRDGDTRTGLQGKIGDTALVLSILQAKGMEFDDVLLWDFFSSSLHLGGLRSLNALLRGECDPLYSEKYAPVCSELKHLYVALTRARLRLFLIESSEVVTQSVVRLLTEDVEKPLVEVVRPSDSNFTRKVACIPSSKSNDPWKWQLQAKQQMDARNYEGAALCFRNAGDKQGQMQAEAYVDEEKGRDAESKERLEESKGHFEKAAVCFEMLGLIGDAVRVRGRLSQWIYAAELWNKHGQPGKAAKLYDHAGQFVKASQCYVAAGMYDKGAVVLRYGNEFGELIFYMNSNQVFLTPELFRSYSRLCKWLIKQGKVPAEHRKDAIELLGTPAEQETTFKEYGMQEDLLQLYKQQARYEDQYNLLLQMIRLEDALTLAIGKCLPQSSSRLTESSFLKLVNYVYAGYLVTLPPSRNLSHLKAEGMTPRMAGLIQSWEQLLEYKRGQKLSQPQIFAALDNPVTKSFVSLQALLDPEPTSQTSSFSGLPFKISQAAVLTIRSLVLKEDEGAWDMVLLLAGVWKDNGSGSSHAVLEWSSFRPLSEGVAAKDIIQKVKEWILVKLSTALLLLELQAKKEFALKWPARCLYFLTLGSCGKLKECKYHHEHAAPEDCSRKIEDLFLINSFVCDANVLYYRQVMTQSFSGNFLAMRRYWLERLLRELTFVSPFEQDSSVVRSMQIKLVGDPQVSIVGSSLEDLLYHRLRRDWMEKPSTYSSLVEQVQMAKMFGRNVQRRFLRALCNKLHYERKGPWMRQNLRTLESLEWIGHEQNPSRYMRDLGWFLDNVKTVEGQQLDAMHAITAIFEKITLLLTIKTCPAAFVVAQAWTHMHIPWMDEATLAAGTISREQQFRYRQVFEGVIRRFCDILTTLENSISRGDVNLTCGGTHVQPRLFQQRNVDLLLIGIVNLSATTPVSKDTVTAVNSVLEFASVRARHLRFGDQTELRQKILPQSFLKYGKKNPLVVAFKDVNQRAAFGELSKQRGVIQTTFNNLRSFMKSEKQSRPTEQTDPAYHMAQEDDSSTAEDKEAAGKIWKFWKKRQPILRSHRRWMEEPEAQIVARFLALSANYTNRDPLRPILVDLGIGTQLRLNPVRDTVSNNHRKAMAMLDSLEAADPSHESLSEAFERLAYFDRALSAAADRISQDNLKKIVDAGDASEVKDLFLAVEKTVIDADSEVRELKKVLKKVAKKDKAAAKASSSKPASTI